MAYQNKMEDEFDSIKLAISSPEDIEKQSYGEVTKPETINYRTQKPEKDGLFDERIFGPAKDYECYCGKYKKIRYKGVVCDKCGVEVTRSSVRRERMGHIKLSVPITHIWYFKGNPSPIGMVLDLTTRELERVIYFGSYVVLEVDENVRKAALDSLNKELENSKKDDKLDKQSRKGNPDMNFNFQIAKSELASLKSNSVISETKYLELSMKYGQIVKVGIGAEAVFELLKLVDLDKEIKILEEETKSLANQENKKLLRRLKFLTGLKNSGIKPEWMVLNILPVLPPDLRPMVQLDGGRFAASDLNDLYRRVINRNNRLKRLIDQGAPEVICRNEKRMLQEAVDALIDNSAKKEKAVTTTTGRRQLKSLSDMLRGKQGRFRQNLLGKRVDYSGRSVIVVGPQLKLNECGLPKTMALELFKPFVISKLIGEGYAHNVKNASRLIEKNAPEIWDILEKIILDSYVLLNRAPTLHRLGIQAFKPVLIEGKSIEIHPFVCSAYNADFDGDQMAVFLPLSEQAKYESANLMYSSTNLLKPASGDPIVTPNRDVVLGLHYLTMIKNEEGEKSVKYFSSTYEAIRSWNEGAIKLKTKISIKIDDEIIETSVGRVIFNQALPSNRKFINKVIDAGSLKQILSGYISAGDNVSAVYVVDSLKDLGFYWATKAGITFSADDIRVPKEKAALLAEAKKELAKIYEQFAKGLISESERYMMVVDLWTKYKSIIEKKMLESFEPDNPIFEMVQSKARGTVSQLTQIAGMKGLVTNPAGRVIELPVESNYKEGLTEFEYFTSSHGARKGRADTALRTSDSGYLTRRLVDVSQDVVVMNDDCKTKEFITLTKIDSVEMDVPFAKRILGRNAANDIIDPKTKSVIVKKGKEIDEESSQKIESTDIESVNVFSVLTCSNTRGVCQKCYGRDLSKNKIVDLGTAVGIIAAQAIGEPGTQLTMRVFHLGGIAGVDITQGLPRVAELFEARTPKSPAIISDIGGRVIINKSKDTRVVSIISKEKRNEVYDLKEGFKPTIKNNENVKEKQVIAISNTRRPIRANFDGIAKIKGNIIDLRSKNFISREWEIADSVQLRVEDGEEVEKGVQVTEGHWNLGEALRLLSENAVQRYILTEVLSIYSSQGQGINEKHVELIIRQMFSRVKIVNPGDSIYLPGEIISRAEAVEECARLKSEKKKELTYMDILLGISTVALNTESFLSAASFQETTNVLIKAATQGKIDKLKGLKENVIIGRAIPAGTGFKNSIYKAEMEEHLKVKTKEREKELAARIKRLESEANDIDEES